MKIDLKALKNDLLKSNKSIEKFFFKEKDGIKSGFKISNNVDNLIKKIFDSSLDNKFFNKIAVCALGSYGREELAPFSDLDIIFIYRNKLSKNSEAVIKKVLHSLWDLEFKIGHSVRSIEDVYLTAAHDVMIATSVIDLRFICGNFIIYKTASKKIEKIFKKPNNFIESKIREIEKNYLINYKDSFLLEPEIKNSVGGIRDVNFIHWFLKIKFKCNNIDEAFNKKIISFNEARKLKNLKSFLFNIRFFLHYLSRRPNERLTFDFQKKIASLMHYKSRKKTLGVERFMKHYFLQIRNCKNLQNIILDDKKFFYKLINFKPSNYFLSDQKFLHVKNENFFIKNPTNFLRYFRKCLDESKQPSYRSIRLMLDQINFISLNKFQNPENFKIFLHILLNDHSNKITELTNQIGILSKIIPEFSKIVAQAQFDRHHVYTVDQHTLFALKKLKRFHYDNTDNNFLFVKNILNRIKNKVPLYLATLLHDIGKGFENQHESTGSKLSKKIATRLNLNSEDCKVVSWLVLNHLVFCDLAFKKDIDDPEIIKEFVKKIKKIERLKSLFVLTVVDLSSVNDDVMNSWKEYLLVKLYKKCEKEFYEPSINKKKKDVITSQQEKTFQLCVNTDFKCFKKFCSLTNDNYWVFQTPNNIAQQVDLFFSNEKNFTNENYFLKKDSVEGFIELIIITKNRRKLLVDLTSVIIASGLGVFNARIFTLKNNMVIDIFKISPIDTIKKIKNFDINLKIEDLRKNLKFFFNKQQKSIILETEEKKEVLKKTLKINFDNVSSKYTILQIKTNDRQFLLIDILYAIHKYGAEVFSAKISTFGDIIEDIFYIKKNDLKILDNQKINEFKALIRQKIFN